MTQNTAASWAQKGISGSALKLIAIAAMLLDHIAAAAIPPYCYDGSLSVPYFAFRSIGRIAFPIFCFLLTEGFFHTKNLKKFCLRLALFALISEIPFDLAFRKKLWEPASQNVFFTLLIGLLTISAMQRLKDAFFKNPLFFLPCDAVLLFAGMQAANFFETDYAATGVLVIVLFYELRFSRTLACSASCAVLCVLSPIELAAFAALPLIQSYNGKRGLSLKYIFYFFYPVHLLLIWLFCYFFVPFF